MPILILLMLTSLLFGCQSQKDKNTAAVVAPESQPTLQVMQQSIQPVLLELPSQAPQIWRQYQQQKPALVLFSEHPFLEPINPKLMHRVNRLLKKGDAAEFIQHDSLQRCDPVLLPQQTLTAALANHYFPEVVWYFPSREKLADIKVDKLREQMLKAGFLSAAEAAKLQQIDEGVFSGEVRGVPLRILHPLAALPEIGHPIVLHLDLSFFHGLYKNEVSTPLYNQLQETAQLLRDSHWKTLAVTLSHSTEGGIFSLATRFLITDLAHLLKTPSLLDGKMPESWTNRKEAMFSQNFFQESKSRELIQQNASKFPDDPTVQYDLYQLLVEAGDNKAAFAQLDRTVALDPGYAEEYLALAETGEKKGWHDQVLQLLEKAAKVSPQNPFIQMQEAGILMQLKREAEAQTIYTRLEQCSWSQYYYPEMVVNLQKQLASFKSEAAPKVKPK